MTVRVLGTATLALGVAGIVHFQGTLPPIMRGANVIQTSSAPLGGARSHASLERLRALGANAVTLSPFLYQSSPGSRTVVHGDAVSDAQLVAGIRDAHRLGFVVLVKPHIWVPGHWAGEVAMSSTDDWTRWFGSYTRELVRYAAIAQSEGAEVFVIGVELEKTIARPEWLEVVRAVRGVYRGRVTYVAHGLDELPRVPFWSQLDLVAISSYPVFPADTSEAALAGVVNATVESMRRFALRTGKPILLAEVGLRSARDAQLKPWESAEERVAPPDELIQARVLRLWLRATSAKPFIGTLVWRWLTDPDAGGPRDTDFTPQHKLAEGVLMAGWRP